MAKKSKRTSTVRRSSRFKLTRKTVGLLICVALIAITGGIVLAMRNNNPATQPGTSSAGSSTSGKINYGPPTQAQKQDATQHKKDIVTQQDSSKTGSGNAASGSVIPVITNAQQNGDGSVKVSAYVQGVVEDGGTCTLKATKDGSSFNPVDSPAIMNVSTTSCKTFSVPRSYFSSPGAWLISVSYTSPTSNGTSASQTLEVK